MAGVFDAMPAEAPPAAKQPEAALPFPTPGILPPQGFSASSFGYDGFGMTVTFAWESGLRAAPLCGPARSRTVYWRAHAETSHKVIVCAASRCLLPPVMPHVDTGDPNDVLLRREVSLPASMAFADGTQRLVVVQRLTYATQYAQDLAGTIVVPNSVLDLGDVALIDPTTFLTLLHGPPSPPAEASGVRAVAF